MITSIAAYKSDGQSGAQLNIGLPFRRIEITYGCITVWGKGPGDLIALHTSDKIFHFDNT